MTLRELKKWMKRERVEDIDIVPPGRVLPVSVVAPWSRWNHDMNFVRNQDVLIIAVPVDRKLLSDAYDYAGANIIVNEAANVARRAVRERMHAARD